VNWVLSVSHSYAIERKISRPTDAAGCIMFAGCPSVCACVRACLEGDILRLACRRLLVDNIFVKIPEKHL